MLKYTKSLLSKIEDVLLESGYVVRYEKGKFKSGYCILKDSKLVMVNTFLPLEGRINAMIEVLKLIQIDPDKLSDASKKLLKNNFPELSLASPPTPIKITD
jgi:DNA-binding MarR family transcriptional regulator